MAKLVVVVATIGRAALVAHTVKLLAQQRRRPDQVIVVGVDDADMLGVADGSDLPVLCLRGEKGLTRQRNRALRHLDGEADTVVFFDDDFVPAPDYLWQVEQAFEAEADLVGITGRVIADGIHGAGYSVAQALALIAADTPPHTPKRAPRRALYGCNMAMRMSAAKGLWFDERLPLYGWQEDIDFTFQLGRKGRLVRCDKPAGVHLGAKGGRQSGKRLGYSQIANPIYLLRKRTIPPQLACRIMFRNIVSNLVRSVRPEPHIDRAGRLHGNVIALGHGLLGRLHPENILTL
jgi:GT2 family glycosyltransferase